VTPLDQRIVHALQGDGITSEAVTRLVEETESAAAAAEELAVRARGRALDPLLASEEIQSARDEAEAAVFHRDRLTAAVGRLGQRRRELLAAEEERQRRNAYDAVKAERDKLAAELKEFYPAVAERLASLAARILANNEMLKRVNHRMPRGAEWLACSESVARNIPGGFATLAAPPRIADHLKLPAFRSKQTRHYIWPPHG
jgi:hypothetical protein